MRDLRRRAITMLVTNGGDHPCVMLTDSMKRQGEGRPEILWVPLTTAIKNYDPTCDLTAGEDELLPEGGWAYYADMRIQKVHYLKGTIVKRRRAVNMIGQELYRRMCAGVLLSSETPPKALDFFNEALRRGKAG